MKYYLRVLGVLRSTKIMDISMLKINSYGLETLHSDRPHHATIYLKKNKTHQARYIHIDCNNRFPVKIQLNAE